MFWIVFCIAERERRDPWHHDVTTANTRDPAVEARLLPRLATHAARPLARLLSLALAPPTLRRQWDKLPLAPRRLIVLAPHMDDEVIGCGGLIRHVVESGGRVSCIYLTDGAHGLHGEARRARARIRRRETEAVAALLGIQELHFLDQPDGHLAYSTELAVSMLAVLRSSSPDLLLLPHPCDPHPDHRAVLDIAARTLAEAPEANGIDIGFYQVRAPLPLDDITHVHDISAVLPIKAKALGLYESQPQVPFALLLDTQRIQGAFRGLRTRAAEVFSLMPLQNMLARQAALPYAGRNVWNRPAAVLDGLRTRQPLITRLRQRLRPREGERLFFEAAHLQRDPWGYDSSAYESRKRNTLLSVLPRRRFANVVDIGCSTGTTTAALAERATARLDALDRSLIAALRARRRLRHQHKAHVHRGDFLRWTAPCRYDLLVCSEILYFFWEPEHVRNAWIRKLGAIAADDAVLAVVWGGFRLEQDWNRALDESGDWHLHDSRFEPDPFRDYRISIFTRKTAAPG